MGDLLKRHAIWNRCQWKPTPGRREPRQRRSWRSDQRQLEQLLHVAWPESAANLYHGSFLQSRIVGTRRCAEEPIALSLLQEREHRARQEVFLRRACERRIE